MATGTNNAKSQALKARVPHDIVEAMEDVKQDGESTSQFIIASMQGEIKRRQRRKKQEAE
ncbi:YlcI/YnfO family protein [Lelliottia wanjuensis]|uniref:YlcI/YnfO family protein n=1 Tax=Lelliottia wanjuensis TaxID=3050585 RepID=UPI00254F1C5B|nr:YlcI/YnfO family protein [Lelliottia sp. V106_16]MDK9356724.1 YlcI/YnfO family protein [Lelliottia sp. V106_16]